ncbi:hypothetical protein Patl1_01774 [Pistacia atlantica]|uniref:Uncharacterized protein n=1 Tax=Pistacia atlantica TaxID=434234 RepID=A0ACC1C6U6_9ROSI|nr:hypothetical protein Patl1_01774 [Pistacia atlantica]
MKFLKAKRFKVQKAFEMLRKTLKWRRDYNVDSILEEDFGPDIDNIMYLNCHDRQGHPLYFNVYAALNNIELFKTENKDEKFFRLKVQFMEKDLKNSPSSGKKICLVDKKALKMIRENYPDVIHKNMVINVPFWCYVCHTMSSTFKTRRHRTKFVYTTPSNATKTLLKFIGPEHLPVEYGGLNRKDEEFFPEDKASELIVKKNSVGIIQIPVHETRVTMIWDLTVVGWDVSYREEFIPDDEGSYRVLLHEGRERNREESIRNSFYINEPGKIVITIDNATFKKKRVFYRFKIKPTVPMYIYLSK